MVLTKHNTLLSQATAGLPQALVSRAVNCTEPRLAELIADSLAANTRRAYRSDLSHFLSWGGDVPASPELLASYLAEHAERLSVATLARRLASVAAAHEAAGAPSPCQSALVRAAMRGIRRRNGSAQKQARPLLRDDLIVTLDRLGSTLRDARDRALLLLGFAGGFRRSEIVGLDYGDLQRVSQGVVLRLRFSKTDQEGAGRSIGIPRGRTLHCPVSALDDWLQQSCIKNGPVFRQVDRHGRVHQSRLSGEAVSLIVRQRAGAAGLDPSGFSGHSLRAGLATSAAQAGLPLWRIRRQTGHASDAMLSRYVRDTELFRGNVVTELL